MFQIPTLKAVTFMASALLLAIVSESQASDVELEITPVWPGDDQKAGVQIAPIVEPHKLLKSVDGANAPATFEYGPPPAGEYGTWTMVTHPLIAGLTDIRLQFKSKLDNNERIHPTIVLSLPLRTRTYPIPVRLFTSPPLSNVLNHYKRAPTTKVDQRLDAYLAAEHTISHVVGDGDVNQLVFSANLVRVATVYAESVSWLVGHTEFFGLPRNLKERMELLEFLQVKLETEQSLRSQANFARYKKAIAALDSAPNQLVRRLWVYSLKASAFCQNRFPIARALHQEMVRMPDIQYNKLVEDIKISRASALEVAIGCFRQLVSRDGDTQYIMDKIVAEDFGGDSARTVYEYLWEASLKEFSARGYAVQLDGSGVPCSQSGLEPKLAKLCSDFNYLKQIDDAIDWEKTS
ncbi:MAG: hypothetical protein ACR2O8_14760 [Rhizobiaceae bacterium]